MAEFRFKLVSGKYIYGACTCPDGDVQETLKLTVDKSLWPDAVPNNIRNKMNRYKYLVDTYIGKCEKADEPITKAAIVAIIQTERDGAAKSKKKTLSDAFNEYCRLVDEDVFKYDGRPYSKGRKWQLKAIKGHLKKTKLGLMPINQFSEDDFAAYTNYLIAKERAQNSLATYTKNLLFFFQVTYAKPYQWHSNRIFDNKKLRVSDEEVDAGVIVTESDTKQLRGLADLSELEAEVLDVFEFGCNIGLRYSDLYLLQKAAGKANRLELNTEKTDTTLYIPLNTPANAIWSKYVGQIPKIEYVEFLTTIRDLGARAKLDEMCLVSRTEGGKRIREYYPKHELLGTHTMRRTFATNAFKNKVPVKLIMRITGHKTESSFYRYIRINSIEGADIMEEYSFFK